MTEAALHPPARPRSLWSDAWSRLKANRAAYWSGMFLLGMIIACLIGPFFTGHAFNTIYQDYVRVPPSLSPYPKPDMIGSALADAMRRARVTMEQWQEDKGAVIVAVTAAQPIDERITRYLDRSSTFEIMMRIVDVLYSLPFVFFVIMLVVFFGRHFLLMFLGIAAVLWLDMARIVRGQTLSIKRQEYVQAAEALGVDSTGILLRHVIPNLLGPVVIYATLLVPQVIILESFLSYFGLGVQEPMSSWGVLIAQGKNNIPAANWLLIFPSLFLTSTLFALNFIGDGLRDALDPRDR